MSAPLLGVEIKYTANKMANDDGSKQGLGTHRKVKIDLEIIQTIKIETLHPYIQNHNKETGINKTAYIVFALSPTLIHIRNESSDNKRRFHLQIQIVINFWREYRKILSSWLIALDFLDVKIMDSLIGRTY